MKNSNSPTYIDANNHSNPDESFEAYAETDNTMKKGRQRTFWESVSAPFSGMIKSKQEFARDEIIKSKALRMKKLANEMKQMEQESNVIITRSKREKDEKLKHIEEQTESKLQEIRYSSANAYNQEVDDITNYVNSTQAKIKADHQRNMEQLYKQQAEIKAKYQK